MLSPHQARITAAVISLDSATAAFVAYLEQLPDDVAERALPGGWTPSGHAAHLALTNDVFSGVIERNGPLAAFAGTSDFSDTAWHLDAPPRGVVAPSILVPAIDVSRATAAAELRQSVRRLRRAISGLDPALAAMCVQLPWAVVSLYQMSEWGGGHTVRHLSQVSRELQVAVTSHATMAL